MQEYVPLGYIIYLAFYNARVYGIEEKIRIDDLLLYKEKLLYNVSKKYEYKFEENNIIEELNSFIEDNPEFNITNGYILLNDELSKNDLIDKRFDYKLSNDKLNMNVVIESNSLELLSILGYCSMLEKSKKMVKMESILESFYCNNYSNSIKDQIDFILLINYLVYNKLNEKNYDTTDSYVQIINRLDKSNYIEIGLLDNINVKDSLFSNEYHNSYVSQNNDLLLKSIFTNKPLSTSKLMFNIMQMTVLKEEASMNELLDNYDEDEDDYFDDLIEEDDFEEESIEDVIKNDEKYDDEEDFFAEQLQTSLYFILKLVEKIDNNLKVDDGLIETRNRLLYLIDNYNLKLYNPSNLKNTIENYDMMSLNVEKYATRYCDFAKAFIIDVFNKPKNENTYKELLFISTYYELTDNEIIKEEILKYKNNKNYQNYCEIIFGKEKPKTKIKE